MNTENLKALRKYPKVIAKLRKVREFIRKHPKHLNMDVWVNPNGKGSWGASTCGTTACIAGWYGLIEGAKIGEVGYTTFGRAMFPVTIRGKKFDEVGDYLPHVAPDVNWERLFHRSEWPEEFNNAYRDELFINSNPRGAANITAKRITHFLRTGE